MRTVDSHPAGNAGATWQLLGELEVSAGSKAEEKILAWFTNVLIPLELHPEFVTLIMKSVHNGLARAFQAGDGQKSDHIHLMIFGPQDLVSKGHSWGFFRLEKIGRRDTGIASPDHTIELYLYREGG